MREGGSPGEIREQIVGLIRSKKGHIADLDEVLGVAAAALRDAGKARELLEDMAGEGVITVAGDSVFLSSERYLPRVRCLICDGIIDRKDLVPFYRERHFPFVGWGFHRGCLEDGVLDELLASGMFRAEEGMIFPNYEYGGGKNPITVAIRFLRSEDFLYLLELKGTGGRSGDV